MLFPAIILPFGKGKKASGGEGGGEKGFMLWGLTLSIFEKFLYITSLNRNLNSLPVWLPCFAGL